MNTYKRFQKLFENSKILSMYLLRLIWSKNWILSTRLSY